MPYAHGRSAEGRGGRQGETMVGKDVREEEAGKKGGEGMGWEDCNSVRETTASAVALEECCGQ